MKKFTIGAGQNADELGDCLIQASERLQAQGILLQGEKFTRGKFTFYTYRLTGTQNGKVDAVTSVAVQMLAEAVADYVTQVWERHELSRIVSHDFYFYGADEIEYLTESAMEMLADLVGDDGRPLRYVHVIEQAAEQLLQGRELVIDGLLRFRMQALQEDLHRVIEQAIDEYLLDLEYQEFVKLLRYFLEVQEPGMPVLHMVCVNERDIRLYNTEGKPLGVDDLLRVANFSDQEQSISVEDTMSVLISLAPQKLLIHLVQGSEQAPPVAETVLRVFQERAVTCQSCPLCEAHAWGQVPTVTEQNRQ